jgi:hypothetical protein
MVGIVRLRAAFARAKIAIGDSFGDLTHGRKPPAPIDDGDDGLRPALLYDLFSGGPCGAG